MELMWELLEISGEKRPVQILVSLLPPDTPRPLIFIYIAKHNPQQKKPKKKRKREGAKLLRWGHTSSQGNERTLSPQGRDLLVK